ncbi:MAG: MGDG synthase family glycosyltransferase, partial [Mycobacterium leprae]
PTVNALFTKGFIQLLTTAPGLYRLAYNQAEIPGRWAGIKHSSLGTMGRVMWPKLLPLLTRFRPDAILCTHPFPLGAMAEMRRRGLLPVPLAGVLTDFAPHSFWVHEGVDHYYVAAPEMVAAMGEQGVEPAQVTVTGIPVRRAFADAPSRTEAARLLGLDPLRPTVLIMGGGLGLGPMREIVAEVSRTALPLQILAVTGHNHRLYEQLQPLAAAAQGGPTAVHLYEYVPYVQTLMAASDLLVTKAGAVTASEALTMGLPMLLVDPIPGHEERNQELLVAAGAARAVSAPPEIPAVLSALAQNPAMLAQMRTAALRLGQPAAAVQVIHHVAGLVRHDAIAVPGLIPQEQVCTA